ncbi:MAG: PDZ domain-containing protein [Planctomycetia bacterium]|nr:PDZ domain-containing protein [Planctomycetia bacterium]
MDQFVCVRIVQANAMDLSLFQFDYDLTFAVFFMNADGTIYGRYGSRAGRDKDGEAISLEGLREAMEAALALHKNYPANKASLKGKQPVPVARKRPEEFTELAKYQPTLDYPGKVVQSCMHCHQIMDAERKELRSAQKPFPDDVLYPWPMPDVLGLALDVKKRATAADVREGSAAWAAGFEPGDEIATLQGQPIVSIADVQWVLHNAPAKGALDAEILRAGQKKRLRIALADGWRQRSDLAWRTTTWDLRRMATGGLLLETLLAEQRQKLGLADGEPALLVKHVGQYGDHAEGKNAGFRQNDVIVECDGEPVPATESAFIARVLAEHKAGSQMSLTVLRGGEKLTLKMRAK